MCVCVCVLHNNRSGVPQLYPMIYERGCHSGSSTWSSAGQENIKEASSKLLSNESIKSTFVI